MSLPPTVIRVKRKADSEESPVTFLQIDTGNKRHRSDSDWIYRRRIAAAARPTASVTPPHLERPVIHSSVPVSQSEVPAGSTKPPALQNGSAASTGIKQQSVVALDLGTNKSTKSASTGRSAKRRFHLVYADQSATLKHGGITKKQRYQAATFIERSKAAAGEESETSSDEAVTGKVPDSSKDMPPPLVERPQKKPGARSKITPRPLPPSMVSPFEDPTTLIPKMDAWTLDMISKNLAEIETRNAPPKPATTKPGIRPKPPAKRFAEREPELARKLDEQYGTARRAEKERSIEDAVMTDSSDNEEGSWVVDEYERVPAHRWVAELEDPTAIGVLVIDTEEAMQEFYAGNDESDTDYGSDDEDENAENHYTADYPEDEVDSDDEYGRDPYAFRNNNASDDEEFDTTTFDDDIYGSDEDNDVDDLQAQFRRHMRGLGR